MVFRSYRIDLKKLKLTHFPLSVKKEGDFHVTVESWMVDTGAEGWGRLQSPMNREAKALLPRWVRGVPM
jgi:hypothetical protein